MEKLPDWEKRLKNLYIDTSGIKNFIRLDWSKKSRERKDKYNKRVDDVIAYAKTLNDDYGKMVTLLGELSGKYINNHVDVSKRLNEALKDTNSIQFDLKKFSDQVRSIENATGKADKNFKRAEINVRNCEWIPCKGKPMYLKRLKEYQEKINNLRKTINTCTQRISDLKEERKSTNTQLSLQQTRSVAVSGEIAMAALSGSSTGYLNRELRNIDREIRSLESDIKRIDSDIAYQKATKEQFEKSLSDLDNKIFESGNKIIENGLLTISTFVADMRNFIKYHTGQLSKLQAKIAEESQSGEILSQDELQQFTNMVNSFPETIKSLEELPKAGAKGNDYGEGFFRTISTKEEKLEELDKKFHEIKTDIRKTREKMTQYAKQIEKYKNYKGNAEAEAHIRDTIKPIKEESEKFKKIIADKEKEFNDALNKTNIQIIKPFYSEKDKLLERVEEVSIKF